MVLDNMLPFKRCRLGAHRFALPDAFMLPFDVGFFDENDFKRHHLERPLSITRSVPKRQAEYLAGRRAALAALHEAGSTATDLPIGQNRAPSWPSGFIGSISHTHGIAVAIALPTTVGVSGIGIDIERVMPPNQMAAIRDVAIDEREYDLLASLADARGWPYALTLAFSSKESFYKAAAATVDRLFDFSALRIEACDIANAYLEARIADTLAPGLPAGQRHALRWVDVSPGTLLTSCAW